MGKSKNGKTKLNKSVKGVKGGPKRKGAVGDAAKYITRARALRKLQLSLVDFRRLCILKGIYPREPKNKKKVDKAGANRTYYFTKDILFLSHEPLIDKFRQDKIFVRKIKKAVAKKQHYAAEQLRGQKYDAKYRLDHIIKERFPTFIDALRDLDDALSMVFLFATMPTSRFKSISNALVSKCIRLSAEFQHYVIQTRSLRKTFVSIKGIYYQVEISGQVITWITPHQFSQDIPDDVDFRVMMTFLEFYTELLGFVNFRLFHTLNLKYPPPLDKAADGAAMGLAAYRLQTQTMTATLEEENVPETEVDEEQQKLKKESEERVKSIGKVLADIQEEEDVKSSHNAEDDIKENAISAPMFDRFPEQMKGGDAIMAELPEAQKATEELEKFTHMFDAYRFFLSREVPRPSLEFVIKAFGGKVSWGTVEDNKSNSAPFSEDDTSITHQITDRPTLPRTLLGRHYVQPQWVFDSVNSRVPVKTASYAAGAVLPPHLSPFVKETEGDYVPPERIQQLRDQGKNEEADAAEFAMGDLLDEDELDEDDEREQDAARIEDEYRKELDAESRGAEFGQGGSLGNQPSKDRVNKAKARAKAAEEARQKKMSTIVLSKKQKRLYGQIMHGKEKKKEAAKEMKRKRAKFDSEKEKSSEKKVKENKKSRK